MSCHMGAWGVSLPRTPPRRSEAGVPRALAPHRSTPSPAPSPSCISHKPQVWFANSFLSSLRHTEAVVHVDVDIRLPSAWDSWCFGCREVGGERPQTSITPDETNPQRCVHVRSIEHWSPTADGAKLLRPKPHPWVCGLHHDTRLVAVGPTPRRPDFSQAALP